MERDVNKQEYDAKRVEIRNNMHINISNCFLMQFSWSFKNLAAGKLILLLIACADYRNDKNFYRSRCWARELAHYICVEGRNWSADIRRIITAAKKETINYGGGTTSWFDFIEYDKDSQDIVWQINRDLELFFLDTYNKVYRDSQKNIGYVNVKLEECMKFKHSYSLRIYFLGLIYAGFRGKIYSVEEFVSLLDLPESYARYGLLRSEVLEKAVDDICDHTDLRIKFYVDNYKYKRANKVIMFKLTANIRIQEEKQIASNVVGGANIDANEENETICSNMNEAEKLLRQYLKSEKIIKRLVDNYDYKRIRRNVEYSKQAHDKNGVGYGLIVKAIENDYAAGNPLYMTWDEQQQWYYQQLGIGGDVCPL